MLKEARQSYSIICQVRFLSNNHDIVFPPFLIHLHQLFSITSLALRTNAKMQRLRPYMKAIPTMPKPTTTTRFLLSGGRGYC